MPITVLIVEDEPAILELIAYTCMSAGMQVLRASNVRQAKAQMQESTPDIVLLDWMLPEVSGLSWLQELRTQPTVKRVAVIILTARGLEDDKVTGLDSGADDYIVKPFSPRELISRIKAVLRRQERHADEVIECGALRMDLDNFSASIAGQAVKLSVSEFKMLAVFARHPGRVYSRQQLIDAVWGCEADIDERTVDVHMLRLRKQLAHTPFKDFIETVRGLGYRATRKSCS